MTVKFKNAQKRTQINKAGLTDIYTRLFGAPDAKILKPELERRIKTFGSCECDDKSCREPFKGYCEFDHKYRNSDAREGDLIDWRALTKACHNLKTRKRDTPNAAKSKRTDRKYNPEYMEPVKGNKPTRKFGKRPFPKAPEDYKHFQSGPISGFSRNRKPNRVRYDD